MADNTKIEWTEATWNPVTGCSVATPGCTNCYAMKLAGTRLAHHWSRKGLTRDTKAGPVWTGEVRFNEEWLTQPLKWKRPRMIFVCAHGDQFHENVPDEWIDQVFAIMALCPQHTFQVLTKRSDRMRRYLADPATPDRIYELVCTLVFASAALVDIVLIEPGLPINMAPAGRHVHLGVWPLPNVWLGVSVEDQARADQRIPDLLATPAAVRWLSCEPLLGPVALSGTSDDRKRIWNWLTGETGTMCPDGPDFDYGPRIDWVVVGGESGADARAMHPDWARALRDQCHDAVVPFFFKQWGLRFPVGQTRADGTVQEETVQGGFANLHKSYAGRLLDGVLHDGFPSPRS